MASLFLDRQQPHLSQSKHAKAEQLFCDWLKSCGQLLAPNKIKIVIVLHFCKKRILFPPKFVHLCQFIDSVI